MPELVTQCISSEGERSNIVQAQGFVGSFAIVIAGNCAPPERGLNIGRMGESFEAKATHRPGLVVSALGADRPGLIRDFSTQIRTRGGNIEDTRMSKLGGEFAVLMLVTGPEAALSAILSAKASIEAALNIVCHFKQTTSGDLPQGELMRFSASGFDRAGIVEAVSQVLAERNVNVTSFLSRIENAPLSGTPLFVLEAEARIPDGVTRSDVFVELAAACEREGLELVAEDQ